ncbi:MAG TPA: hypothetical protein VK157_09865 [Phycisphaerales bacterium]|nr:hypothetical protein [Phycisphaerales bacterium]
MRTVYQKLKPRQTTRHTVTMPAVSSPVPMPLPRSAAVLCARCRREATFYTAAATWCHPMDAQSEAAWRHRVVVEPRGDDCSTVWYFPHIVPPGTKGAGSSFLVYRHYFQGDVGVVECATCGTQRRHELRWPRDAFYRVSVGRATLWAADRADMVELRAYIASSDRRQMYRSGVAHWATRYLPRDVIVAKNRERVVAAVDTLLART